MDSNKIRRVSTASALALCATVALGFASPASAVVAADKAVADSAAVDKAAVDPAPVDGKGEVVTQDGVVTSPVVTDGKDGDLATVFKVTDADRTLPWVANDKTVVIKGGVPVPATAIEQGDRVSATGVLVKGKVAQAAKIVVHDAA